MNVTIVRTLVVLVVAIQMMNWYRLTVCVLLACWYLYQPVPEGYTRPWRLRMVGAVQKIFMDTLDLAEKLGLGTFQDSVNGITRYFDPDTPHERITDMMVGGVHARVYNMGDKGGGSKPGLVYFHGSCWIADNIKMYDDFLLTLVDAMDIVIISIDYRLSGCDVKFPEPLQDCVSGTQYIMYKAEQFNVNPERIAIGGDSSGGNLAAAVALKLRDDKFHSMPKLQLLINPALQAIDFSLPSYVQNSDGPLLTRYFAAKCWTIYATGAAHHTSAVVSNKHTTPEIKRRFSRKQINHDDLDSSYHYAPYLKPRMNIGDDDTWAELERVFTDPYFAPLLADDLAGLPEAYVYSSQADVLRDDAILYVHRLRDAGVPVTHVNDVAGVHGSCLLDLPDSRCTHEVITFLKTNL